MKWILVFGFILSGFGLSAQVKIKGKITDGRHKPVGGASVVLKDTYDGATADSLGNFSFSTTEKGEQTVQISIIGYRSYEEKVSITGAPITLNIVLKELVTELKAVVISAGSFEASDKNKGAVLSAIDIVTTPSANGDVTVLLKLCQAPSKWGKVKACL